MSEYYGVQRSEEYLSHYGIKGMKWGVRRYLDDWARPNEKWDKLYNNPNKKVKPLTIQRHFNQIDKEYAKIKAKEKAKGIELNDLLLSYTNFNKKKKQKWGEINPFTTGEQTHNAKKILNRRKRLMKQEQKLKNAIDKTIRYGRTYATENHNLEAMQDALAAKATNYGYTVKSKDKLHMPYAIVRGRGIGVIPVGGQHIKVRKHGNGQANFTMYKDGSSHNVNLTTGKITKKKHR